MVSSIHILYIKVRADEINMRAKNLKNLFRSEIAQDSLKLKKNIKRKILNLNSFNLLEKNNAFSCTR